MKKKTEGLTEGRRVDREKGRAMREGLKGRFQRMCVGADETCVVMHLATSS